MESRPFGFLRRTQRTQWRRDLFPGHTASLGPWPAKAPAPAAGPTFSAQPSDRKDLCVRTRTLLGPAAFFSALRSEISPGVCFVPRV